MNKILLVFSTLLMFMSVVAFVAPPKNFFSFSAKDIIGNETSFSYFKGKTILVVNLATQCGLVNQIKELQDLYEKYADKDFIVLGFPSNSFGQEGEDNNAIKLTCTRNYGITFPIFSKIDVTGENAHPAFKFLGSKNENGKFDAPVDWNYHKYLIDKNGNVIAHFKPNTSPLSNEIVSAIEQELGLLSADAIKVKNKKEKKRKKVAERP
jgi:glutathione peroxidase